MTAKIFLYHATCFQHFVTFPLILSPGQTHKTKSPSSNRGFQRRSGMERLSSILWRSRQEASSQEIQQDVARSSRGIKSGSSQTSDQFHFANTDNTILVRSGHHRFWTVECADGDSVLDLKQRIERKLNVSVPSSCPRWHNRMNYTWCISF